MRNEAAHWEGYDGPQPPEEVLRRDPRDELKQPSEEFSLPGFAGKPRLVEVGPKQPDPAAALEFNVTDEPHEVLRRIHEADGLIAEDGIFKPERGQFELIRAALGGNQGALERITEHNGLRQWTEAWAGSAKARQVFDEVLQAVAEPTDTGADTVEFVPVVPMEDTREFPAISPEQSQVAADQTPQPDSHARRQRGRKLRRRLRPRFGN